MFRTAARILGAIVASAWLVPVVGALCGREAAPGSESAVMEGTVLTVLVLVAIACTVMSSVRGGRWSLGILADSRDPRTSDPGSRNAQNRRD